MMNTGQVVIFSTGQIVEFDMVCDALKQAKLPYFTRQETASGSIVGTSVGFAGPGVSWLVIVPEPALEDATRVLAELPVELKRESHR